MVTAVQTGLLPEDEQHHIPILKGEPQSDNVSEEKEKSLKGLAHKFKHLFTSAERKVVSTTKRFTDLLHVHTQVDHDFKNYALYPELERDAKLRRDNDLSSEEQQFKRKRNEYIAQSGALKKFLNLEEDVHPDDVPTIAIGGSGGGYRACLGYIAMMEAFQEDDAPLWNIISYTSGVSGACWSLGMLYTIADMNAAFLLDHFSQIAGHHPMGAAAANIVLHSIEGAYFLFGPILHKLKIGLHPQPLDLYSTFTASYMFLPPNPASITAKVSETTHKSVAAVTGKPQEGQHQPQTGLKREYFQWSRVWDRMKIDQGQQPLPILTAVRHERPWKDWKSPTEPFGTTDQAHPAHQEAEKAWWQWIEFSPIEIGSDELEGWVPTWGFGRKFNKGCSIERSPERSLAFLLGQCTSAPAGPLSAYLGTIYRNLPHGFFGDAIKKLSEGFAKAMPETTERFENHHPVHAANEANPFFGAQIEPGRGEGFENSPRIHLVDSGMSNNLPTYVFFRPHRQCDVMILGDYSSDVEKGSALERIDEFAKEKGLSIKPRQTLPPLSELSLVKNAEGKDVPPTLTAEETAARFEGRYAQILDATLLPQDPAKKYTTDDKGIVYNERHVPLAQQGGTCVYMPLLPHKCQPEYNPSTAPFSSSYNLVWTPEQVAMIRKTAKADVKDSIEVLRTVVREVYERKRAARLSNNA